MMRGPEAWSLAVRRPDGGIEVVRESALSLRRKGFLSWPFVRGVVVFVDGLSLGIRALMMSADFAGDESEKLTPAQMTMTIAGAVAFAIALFILLPTVLMSFARRTMAGRPLVLNLVEGGLRALIFTMYVYAISRISEVQRVLEYHGAEHKAINTLDAGEDLTVANARAHSRMHPRCSTSFLLIVVVIGSILFSFFGWPGVLLRIATRLLLLPVVAGISYEIIRFSSVSKSALARAACVPGTWFQRMTTREPDDNQLEVALTALRALVEPREA
jgi:uncharacterized protein YqhQ